MPQVAWRCPFCCNLLLLPSIQKPASSTKCWQTCQPGCTPPQIMPQPSARAATLPESLPARPALGTGQRSLPGTMSPQRQRLFLAFACLMSTPVLCALEPAEWTLPRGFSIANYLPAGASVTNARSLHLSGASKRGGPWITYVGARGTGPQDVRAAACLHGRQGPTPAFLPSAHAAMRPEVVPVPARRWLPLWTCVGVGRQITLRYLSRKGPGAAHNPHLHREWQQDSRLWTLPSAERQHQQVLQAARLEGCPHRVRGPCCR